MAEILRLSGQTPEELLRKIADDEGDKLVSLIVIVRDNKEEIAVYSTGGTGSHHSRRHVFLRGKGHARQFRNYRLKHAKKSAMLPSQMMWASTS